MTTAFSGPASPQPQLDVDLGAHAGRRCCGRNTAYSRRPTQQEALHGHSLTYRATRGGAGGAARVRGALSCQRLLPVPRRQSHSAAHHSPTTSIMPPAKKTPAKKSEKKPKKSGDKKKRTKKRTESYS
eukprot:scaffold97690_cov69-Phaeocystis_antarctica.AAC.1